MWRVTTFSDQIALPCRLSFVPALSPETVCQHNKCVSGDVHVLMSCMCPVFAAVKIWPSFSVCVAVLTSPVS